MNKGLLIAVNSGYVHSNPAVRRLSKKGGIPFVEYNINMPKSDVLFRIEKSRVFCFSCYIWNMTYVLELCADLKLVYPESKILLGGPCVSFNAGKVMEDNPFIDCIICGEGEDVIASVVDALAEGDAPPYGLFRKDGKIIGSEEYLLAKNPDCLVYEKDMVYFESTRGCPFSCAYCLSGFERGGVRRFPMDQVKASLKELADLDVEVVKFVDRTFNANESWASEILEFLLTLNCRTVWHFEIGGDLLTDRLIELLNKGNFQVEIGIQSFNEETLRAVHRHCDLDKLCENVSRLKIHKHVDLIAGLPYEDLASFKQSFDRAFALRADMLQLGFLKVLPGSELEHSEDIVYSGKPPYRVLRTKWLSFEELVELDKVEKAVDTYYNKGKFPLSLDYVLEHFESSYDCFKHLALALGEDVYSPIGHKRAMENMYESCKGLCEDMVLRELIRTDYYLSGAKGNMPDFLEPVDCVAKDVRKAVGLDKNTRFFITEINYKTRKPVRCVVTMDGRITEMEEKL